MTDVIAGTRRVTTSAGDREFRYIGLVRLGRRGAVVAECGHEHRNRDQGGDSATDCARGIIQGARITASAESVAYRFRNRWQWLTMSPFTFPASTIDAAKVQSAKDADAYLAAVAAVREVMACHTGAPATPPPAEPPEIGEMPAWMTGEDHTDEANQ